LAGVSRRELYRYMNKERYEQKSLILTGLGNISIKWDVLKREIFPKGKQIIMRNKKALEETSE
jgi:hypothetical protein